MTSSHQVCLFFMLTAIVFTALIAGAIKIASQEVETQPVYQPTTTRTMTTDTIHKGVCSVTKRGKKYNGVLGLDCVHSTETTITQ